MNHLIRTGLVTAAIMLTITAAQGQERIGPDRYAITLRDVELRPATSREARRILSRIRDAALAVCGAPDGSSTSLKRATMKSQCFREAVDGTVRRIDNPLLTRLHQPPH